LAYTADRLFDTLSLDAAKPRTERHRFMRHHWKRMLSIWVGVFISSVILASKSLPTAHLVGGLWLVLLVNVYFLLLHFSKKIPLLGSLKEILTGALFSLGVSYFPVLSEQGVTNSLLIHQCAFGLLCLTNVLLISHWEFRIDQEQVEAKLAQRSRNRDALLLVAFCTTISTGLLMTATEPGVFNYSLLLSGSALALLHLYAAKQGTDYLKSLIDVPLMLPFFLILFL
jgi:hypothetical protein